MAAHCKCGVSELIANECPYVNIVVEGDCPKLFYNGQKPPDSLGETIQSTYPLVVEKIVEGIRRKAFVVGSFRYGKYTGKFYLKFKEGSGDIEKFHGNSLLMDKTFPKDPFIQNLTEAAQANKSISVYSRVQIDPTICEEGECTFGNLVTDAIVFGRALELHKKTTFPWWSDAYQSFILSDSFQAKVSLAKSGIINVSDLRKALEDSRYFIIEVRASTLKKVFEKLVAFEQNGTVGILQMTGVKARIDRKGLETDIQLLKGAVYQPLDENSFYHIIVEESLYNGTYSTDFNFQDRNVDRPILCSQISNNTLLEYIEYNQFLYPIIKEDITFFTSDGCSWFGVSEFFLVLLLCFVDFF